MAEPALVPQTPPPARPAAEPGSESPALRRAEAPPSSADPALPRLDLPPYDLAAALALEQELGIGHVLAQVLVRRGLTDPRRAAGSSSTARRSTPRSAFDGIETAVADDAPPHRRRPSRITVHGDYDVDGVCATAIMVRALRLARRHGRLVPAGANRGRLRADSGDTVARLASAGHAAADHGRLWDHGGRRGRARARRRAWTSSSPTTTHARRRLAARLSDRAPRRLWLPVP